VTPNFINPSPNYLPGIGMVSQPYGSSEGMYYDQRKPNSIYDYQRRQGYGMNEMQSYGDPQLYDYFYQELVPISKKINDPATIFEKYKQTNNLEDIVEENSLNESESIHLSQVQKDSLSFSSPENLKRIYLATESSEILKSKEPWELDSRAYPKDVFFELQDSHISQNTRRILNASDSINFISPNTSSRLLMNDKGNNFHLKNITTLNKDSKLIKKTNRMNNKISIQGKKKSNDSPLIVQKLYKNIKPEKEDKKSNPVVKIRKFKNSKEKNVIEFNMPLTNSIIVKKKKMANQSKHLKRSTEKVIRTRSKSPVTSAYKKILLENKSKNLDIKDVVQKSLQKSQLRRLSLSPDKKNKWRISKKEFKSIKKNFSLNVLNSKKFNSLKLKNLQKKQKSRFDNQSDLK
jgi:hypothetical protein